jgi:myo-inositol-1(or 4)-monophosphatase
MTDAYDFAVRLAREAGEILLGYYHQPDTNPTYKPDHTLLTTADLAADRFIAERIRSVFPGDHILSEEMDTTFPGDARPTWVVDPLDGTANFSQRIHYWGVSIARLIGGIPEVAALSFPAINEHFAARRGGGAILNGEPLRTLPVQAHPAAFFTCDSRLHRKYTVKLKYKPRILGSAAYNFCAVARGAALVGFESIPKVWDIAASWLVLAEAGGAGECLGEPLFPLKPGADYSVLKYPMLGAVSADVLAESKGLIILK